MNELDLRGLRLRLEGGFPQVVQHVLTEYDRLGRGEWGLRPDARGVVVIRQLFPGNLLRSKTDAAWRWASSSLVSSLGIVPPT